MLDITCKGKSQPELRSDLRLESRLESRLAAKVLILLMKNDAGKAELAYQLGHKTLSGELHKQNKRLLELGFIEMTIPEKPTSNKQKYRLTAKGKAFLDIETAEDGNKGSEYQ